MRQPSILIEDPGNFKKMTLWHNGELNAIAGNHIPEREILNRLKDATCKV